MVAEAATRPSREALYLQQQQREQSCNKILGKMIKDLGQAAAGWTRGRARARTARLRP